MYYYFAPYEQDFRAWWDSKTFPETSPLTRDFLQHITRPDRGDLPVADEDVRRQAVRIRDQCTVGNQKR